MLKHALPPYTHDENRRCRDKTTRKRERMRLGYWTINMTEYMIHLKEAVLMKHGTVYNEYPSAATEKE